VLPAGAFAWRGELAPHALLRRSPGVRMVPRSCGPRSPCSDLLVRASPQSEAELLVRTSKLSEARRRLLVRGGDSSCGMEICRTRWRLLVRDENLSCEAETPRAGRKHVGEAAPPVGVLSWKPPTGRRQGILPVTVLTRIHSPPYIESWPSHCKWCQMTPCEGDYLAVERGA
jgi:hypothetical protein